MRLKMLLKSLTKEMLVIAAAITFSVGIYAVTAEFIGPGLKDSTNNDRPLGTTVNLLVGTNADQIEISNDCTSSTAKICLDSDDNYDMDSSNIVANASGSVIERLEWIMANKVTDKNCQAGTINGAGIDSDSDQVVYGFDYFINGTTHTGSYINPISNGQEVYTAGISCDQTVASIVPASESSVIECNSGYHESGGICVSNWECQFDGNGDMFLECDLASLNPTSLVITPSSKTGMNVIWPSTVWTYTTFTVTNEGDLVSEGLVANISNAANFEFGTNNCTGKNLMNGESCTVQVRSKATSNESFNGNLTISSGDHNVVASLNGTASNIECTVSSDVGDYCSGGIFVGNLLVSAFNDNTWRSYSNATSLCSNSTVGGYNDWSLPSRDQSTILYNNRSVIGGLSLWWYWTNETSGGYIRGMSGGTGSFSMLNTDVVHDALSRCVRTF